MIFHPMSKLWYQSLYESIYIQTYCKNTVNNNNLKTMKKINIICKSQSSPERYIKDVFPRGTQFIWSCIRVELPMSRRAPCWRTTMCWVEWRTMISSDTTLMNQMSIYHMCLYPTSRNSFCLLLQLYLGLGLASKHL